MPKRTLPKWAAPGALYVLAIAAGVLLSKPAAIVLAVLATVVLLLVVAGTTDAQRLIPSLGRLPLVPDHRPADAWAKTRRSAKPRRVPSDQRETREGIAYLLERSVDGVNEGLDAADAAGRFLKPEDDE